MALLLRRADMIHSAATQDDTTSAWTQSVRVTLPWKPNIRPSTMASKDLKPYRKFAKLVGERKFAQNYPLKPFRLLDLPSEVRNQVYRDILVLDQPIELAPKSTGKHNSRAHDVHMKRFKHVIMPRLHLLSTNRAVHAEATSVFYGENEFRFSNIEGWYILSSFLKTIGPDNAGLIRSIAVHVPWYGKALDNRHDGLPESINKMKGMKCLLDSMGLKYPWSWATFQKEACIKRVKQIFEGAGKLESVAYILPDSYILPSPAWRPADIERFFWVYTTGNGSMDPQQVFDESKFAKGLDTTLVRLHGGFFVSKSEQEVMDNRRRHVLETHVDVWDWFEIECGWKVETMVYDKNGKYPVAMRDDDRILSLWELPEVE